MVKIELIEETERFFEETNKHSDPHLSLNRTKMWGFFFHSKSDEKLTQLRSLLAIDGYEFVELEQDVSDFYLNVEKEAVHSVTSLHKQLEEFAVLAEQFEINRIAYNVGSIKRSLDRSQLLKELKSCFPEISSNLNKAKSLQMEIAVFCSFTQSRIDLGDSTTVKKCFEVLEKYFIDGSNVLQKNLYSSFIKCVNFDCKEFENYWILKVEPKDTLPTNGGVLSWKVGT